MKDCKGRTIHNMELVQIINHPEIFFNDYWMVILFVEATKDFVLQHYITKEIKIFSQKDVQATY